VAQLVMGNDPGSRRSRQVRRLFEPARLRLFMMPVKPRGDRYAFGRGESVDRRYIESFLSDNRGLIRGRCMEVGDDRYTRRFGGDAVQKIDILDIDSDNPKATIIGDLQDLSHVESSSFDCIIVTQVLQFLEDPSAGVRELRRILVPGGSALVTMPTMAPIDHINLDMQRFMPLGVSRMFSRFFGGADTVVTSYGNLLTGKAYWSGLAQEDLPQRAWEFDDPTYPVIVGVRATAH
jgi:SAM-dependent methyltransferase